MFSNSPYLGGKKYLEFGAWEEEKESNYFKRRSWEFLA